MRKLSRNCRLYGNTSQIFVIISTDLAHLVGTRASGIQRTLGNRRAQFDSRQCQIKICLQRRASFGATTSSSKICIRKYIYLHLDNKI